MPPVFQMWREALPDGEGNDLSLSDSVEGTRVLTTRRVT